MSSRGSRRPPGTTGGRERDGTQPPDPGSKESRRSLSGRAISDEELIKQCRQGNRRAFDRLVRRYRDSVYSLAFFLIGSCNVARDVTRDTFVRVHGAIVNSRIRGRFAVWVCRICRDLCLFRTTGREAFTEESSARTGPGSRLREAVLELPGELREVVALRYANELSYGEISEVLGLPVETVRTRLYLGRARLRRYLSSPVGE